MLIWKYIDIKFANNENTVCFEIFNIAGSGDFLILSSKVASSDNKQNNHINTCNFVEVKTIVTNAFEALLVLLQTEQESTSGSVLNAAEVLPLRKPGAFPTAWVWRTGIDRTSWWRPESNKHQLLGETGKGTQPVYVQGRG